ncbi:MAG: 1-acyl-sn-glycerol-3-phosphate acyltransferase [Sedimentisphaerales bacterium]|nr:1-acyl-sn-glycerol-3-phosphate acyltransferase [Sedimentisphaerales bacterium]
MKNKYQRFVDTDTVASPRKSKTLLRFSDTTKSVSINFGDPDSPLTLLLEFISKPILKMFRFKEFQEISYRFANDPRSEDFVFQKVLDSFDIKLSYNHEKLSQINRDGPLLIIANHPLALVDGFAISSVIMNCRSDIKILAISGLRKIPHLKDYIIPIRLKNSKKAKEKNRKAIIAGMKWLNGGHTLIIFPAGDISLRKYLWQKDATDAKWAKGLGLLVRRSKANVLPVFFHGQTSMLFQFARSIHKSLGQFLFIRELLLTRNRTIRFVFGDIVNHKVLSKIGNSQDVVDYLRKETYSLKSVPFVADSEKGTK